MPARKAPSAIDTPKICADPTAMPSAMTSTVRVNSSRERVAATRSRTRGMTRAPTIEVNASSADTFRAVSATAIQIDCPDSCGPKTAGSSTIARTVKMSSTTSQPTAMWPADVCREL